MKISYTWLKDYVDVTASPAELADALTMAGLEVESVDRIRGLSDRILVGEVLATERHPKADRLTICTVDTGHGEPLQVLCGADNVAAGQKVPVATVGAQLPSRGPAEAELTIESRTIRGVRSEGMICAEDELGLSEDHSGIMVLDPDARTGLPFAEYLREKTGYAEDYVLDVAVTPNRPDATSHIGVARDVAALTDRPLRMPDVVVPDSAGEAARHVSVSVTSPALCHRYVGVVVRGVTIGESPDWLKMRLEAVGLRPRNNVVDITNYVMYEVGQPLHAFDLDELTDAKIEVRATSGPTTFTTLDDRERVLPSGTLMIRDGVRDVAIAGVMGGQNSEVSDRTRNVLIESAYFDPSSIRRTAKAIGLQTDASYRFERGVDPEGQAWAAMRAAGLMAELAGGTVVEGIVDAHPVPWEPVRLEVRMPRADHLLGTRVPRTQAVRQLRAIGFDVEAQGDDRLLCGIPAHRPDVEREVDVIEEIARLYGYGRIEEPERSRIPNFTPRTRKRDAARGLLFSRLTGWGYRETFTNSLLPEDVAARFYDEAVAGDLSGGSVVTTANAITQDMTTLRPSLLPGLLQVARHNANHGRTDIRLVEMGHVFSRKDDASALIPGYEEHDAFALLLTGQPGDRHWSGEPRPFDFHDIAGVTDAMLGLLRVGGVQRTFRRRPTEVVEYGVSYAREGTYLGFAGRIRHSLAGEFDLQGPVLFAEMNWDRLVEAMPPIQGRAYAPISRFPTVERDLAFTVDSSQEAGPMLELIRSEGGPLLRESGVFDVYEGDRVEAGKKSIAFFVRFGGDRTLTDSEVDGFVRTIVESVTGRFRAELRE